MLVIKKFLGVITIGDGGTTTFTGITIANLSINGCKAVAGACSTAYTGTENIGIFFNSSVSQSKIQNTWIYDSDGAGIEFYSE